MIKLEVEKLRYTVLFREIHVRLCTYSILYILLLFKRDSKLERQIELSAKKCMGKNTDHH